MRTLHIYQTWQPKSPKGPSSYPQKKSGSPESRLQDVPGHHCPRQGLLLHGKAPWRSWSFWLKDGQVSVVQGPFCLRVSNPEAEKGLKNFRHRKSGCCYFREKSMKLSKHQLTIMRMTFQSFVENFWDAWREVLHLQKLDLALQRCPVGPPIPCPGHGRLPEKRHGSLASYGSSPAWKDSYTPNKLTWQLFGQSKQKSSKLRMCSWWLYCLCFCMDLFSFHVFF